MKLRILALMTSLALAGAACGGGGSGGSGTSGGGGGGGTPAPAPASTTRILVAPTTRSDLQALCDQTGATIVTDVPGTDYYVVEVPDGKDAEGYRGEVEGDASVEDAELDEGCQSPEGGPGVGGGGSTIPAFGDDPLSAVAIQSGVSRTGALLARSRGLRGAGVVVAVIDTGVAPTHPLLQDHLAPGGYDFVDEDTDPTDEPNGIDDNQNGQVDEGVGHGSFVASLVLAVAPDAKILVLRALNSDGVGTASGVARAIAYAISHGADVINLSAGLSTDLRLLQQATQSAKASGIPLFAAAGNTGGAVDYPAALSDAVAVTALDGFDRKPAFASFGSAVDFSAPGVDLIGAHPRSPSGTARWSGTSFSTALATGTFAVLRASDTTTASLDLVKRLGDTATSVDFLNPSYAGSLGRGRVDVDRATR